MERLGIKKVHVAGQDCQAVDQPHKAAVTAARTAIPGSTPMAVPKLEKHEGRRRGPRHVVANGTTQEESEDTGPVNHADPKRLTDTVRACTHTSSVVLTAFTRFGSGGFAPGFIVSHSQEKWKWTAGPDTREPGRRSQVKTSDFQVQVRASQPVTTPQRTLQYTEEVKG
jgi:hypothetical protein